MGQNSKGINVSFPIAERQAIEARVHELRLPARGGVSQYFQMLRDYDRHVGLKKHYHEATGTFHFYPPVAADYLQAAESEPDSSSATTDAAAAEEPTGGAAPKAAAAAALHRIRTREQEAALKAAPPPPHK